MTLLQSLNCQNQLFGDSVRSPKIINQEVLVGLSFLYFPSLGVGISFLFFQPPIPSVICFIFKYLFIYFYLFFYVDFPGSKPIVQIETVSKSNPSSGVGSSRCFYCILRPQGESDMGQLADLFSMVGSQLSMLRGREWDRPSGQAGQRVSTWSH